MTALPACFSGGPEMLPKHEIVDFVGRLSASGSAGIWLVRHLFVWLTDMFGGRSGSFEAAVGKASEHAVTALKTAAAANGANAVLNVTTFVTCPNGSTVVVLASGDAVVMKPKNGAAAHGG